MLLITRCSECGSLAKAVKCASRVFSHPTCIKEEDSLGTGGVTTVHGDLAERLCFALISPNDITPYRPDFILHGFRVPEGVPGSTALTGNREGLRKDLVLGRYKLILNIIFVLNP